MVWRRGARAREQEEGRKRERGSVTEGEKEARGSIRGSKLGVEKGRNISSLWCSGDTREER